MIYRIVLLFLIAINTSALACESSAYAKALEVTRTVDQRIIWQLNDVMSAYYGLKQENLTNIRVQLTSSVTQATRALQDGHRALLRAVIRDCGWPTQSEFDATASSTAFLIVQHSDLRYMQEMQEHVRDAFEKRLINGEKWANFVDRLAYYRGVPQVFGTQIIAKGNAMSKSGPELVWEVEDELKLDERRKSMNLVPICQYFANIPIAAPLFERKCRNNSTN